jgi:hypothetical protein
MGIWNIVRAAVKAEQDDEAYHEMPRRRETRTGYSRIREMAMLLAYGCETWSRKKRIPLTMKDIDALVAKWVPVIRGLSIGHTKDEIDRCEFESEEHLAPLLTAPVRDIRVFFSKLVQALKADDSIPLFVWQMFEAYEETVVKRAPDEAVKQLKTEVARRVAELVEQAIKPDFKEALIGALQWRDVKALERIETEVKAGAKPRLRGRESCLFLEAGKALVMV